MKPEKIKNLKGLLCRDIWGKVFLRTTLSDGSSREYRIDHSDLSIKVQDKDAYSYEKDGEWIIDHSPATLGIDEVTGEPKARRRRKKKE